MIRSYRYRLYPTAKQAVVLDDQLAACCDLYNAALEQRVWAWKNHEISLFQYDQYRELTEVRAAGLLPDGMAQRAQRSALERLDNAMQAFFRRVKAGQTPGFPRFRSKARYDSLTWPMDEGASIRGGRLRIMGVGAVRVRWHRKIPDGADIRTITVKRQNGHWYATVVLRLPDSAPLPATGRSVGVDRGVTVPFALSTGELVKGPRAQRAGAAAVRRAQRKVSRRRKGSNRRRKAVVLLARRREREANRRRDFLHKLSRRLVNENDLIAFEDLNVAGMTRSAKGTVAQPGINVAQKRGLSRAIYDQGWGTLARMTSWKAEEAARTVVLVPPAYTSQTCHECGAIDKASRRGTSFRCTSCGHTEHADINAAKNILGAGLALQAPTVEVEAHAVA